MTQKIYSSFVYLLSFAFFEPAFAQATEMEFIREQYLRPGVHIKTWSFEEESGFERFTEIAFPITYSLPVSRRLSLDVVTSPFLSTLSPISGSGESLNNLTDTYIRTSYILGDNLALLNCGVGIPSGKTNLDNKELSIAGIAANRPLDNPVSNLGAGLNLNFGLAVAQKIGSWVLGLGAGYAFKGEYTALLDTSEITVDPGNELNLSFGIDRDFELENGKAKLIADIVFTNYLRDQYSALRSVPLIFEAGDKIVAQVRFLYPLGIFKPISFSIQNRWRLDNKSTNAALIDNGNELELSLALFHPLSDKFRFKYVLDSKIYSNTVDDAEGAFVFGVGLGGIYKISDYFTFDPTVKFSKGKINTGPGTDIGITGFEFSGGLAITF